MKLAAVLCLAVALRLEVQAQTVYCYNGRLPCVTGANCVAEQCVCNQFPNVYGDGRVRCGNPAVRCICGVYKDPFIFLFDERTGSQQTLTANLPCSFNLIQNHAITGGTTSFCRITDVIVHTQTIGSGVRVFASEIEVELSAPALKFTVDASGVHIATGTPSLVTVSQRDGFHVATVSGCKDLEVGFNNTYKAIYLDEPVGFVPLAGARGVCGNCDNNPDENVGTTNVTHLAYLLSNLATAAKQKGAYSSQCGALIGFIPFCTNVTLIADLCGRYLTTFGTCLVSDSTNAIANYGDVMTKFQTCANNLCFSPSSATITAECNAFTAAETTACKVGSIPSCP